MKRLILSLVAVLAASRARADDSLMQAYEILASKRFVDLTQSFGPKTPVWSGFGPAVFSTASDPSTGLPYTIERDGFRTTFYSLPGQYGTHVDAPAHFAPQGATVDQIPLKEMLLPLIVFDATPLLARDSHHAWSVEDIKAWEKKHGPVPAGSFVALRTDMAKDWEKDPERFKRALQFLFEQPKVKNGYGFPARAFAILP